MRGQVASLFDAASTNGDRCRLLIALAAGSVDDDDLLDAQNLFIPYLSNDARRVPPIEALSAVFCTRLLLDRRRETPLEWTQMTPLVGGVLTHPVDPQLWERLSASHPAFQELQQIVQGTAAWQVQLVKAVCRLINDSVWKEKGSSNTLVSSLLECLDVNENAPASSEIILQLQKSISQGPFLREQLLEAHLYARTLVSLSELLVCGIDLRYKTAALQTLEIELRRVHEMGASNLEVLHIRDLVQHISEALCTTVSDLHGLSLQCSSKDEISPATNGDLYSLLDGTESYFGLLSTLMLNILRLEHGADGASEALQRVYFRLSDLITEYDEQYAYEEWRAVSEQQSYIGLLDNDVVRNAYDLLAHVVGTIGIQSYSIVEPLGTEAVSVLVGAAVVDGMMMYSSRTGSDAGSTSGDDSNDEIRSDERDFFVESSVGRRKVMLLLLRRCCRVLRSVPAELLQRWQVEDKRKPGEGGERTKPVTWEHRGALVAWSLNHFVDASGSGDQHAMWDDLCSVLSAFGDVLVKHISDDSPTADTDVVAARVHYMSFLFAHVCNGISVLSESSNPSVVMKYFEVVVTVAISVIPILRDTLIRCSIVEMMNAVLGCASHMEGGESVGSIPLPVCSSVVAHASKWIQEEVSSAGEDHDSLTERHRLVCLLSGTVWIAIARCAAGRSAVMDRIGGRQWASSTVSTYLAFLLGEHDERRWDGQAEENVLSVFSLLLGVVGHDLFEEFGGEIIALVCFLLQPRFKPQVHNRACGLIRHTLSSASHLLVTIASDVLRTLIDLCDPRSYFGDANTTTLSQSESTANVTLLKRDITNQLSEDGCRTMTSVSHVMDDEVYEPVLRIQVLPAIVQTLEEATHKLASHVSDVDITTAVMHRMHALLTATVRSSNRAHPLSALAMESVQAAILELECSVACTLPEASLEELVHILMDDACMLLGQHVADGNDVGGSVSTADWQYYSPSEVPNRMLRPAVGILGTVFRVHSFAADAVSRVRDFLASLVVTSSERSMDVQAQLAYSLVSLAEIGDAEELEYFIERCGRSIYTMLDRPFQIATRIAYFFLLAGKVIGEGYGKYIPASVFRQSIERIPMGTTADPFRDWARDNAVAVQAAVVICDEFLTDENCEELLRELSWVGLRVWSTMCRRKSVSGEGQTSDGVLLLHALRQLTQYVAGNALPAVVERIIAATGRTGEWTALVQRCESV